MDVELITDIGGLGRDVFDGLDATAGAAGCYDRVRQREADGRWDVRYVCATESGQVRAVVPLYRCRARAWPDPAYDPRAWRLPPEAAGDCEPERCLLVEGCLDLRSGLHVQDSVRDSGGLRQLLVTIARVAAERGQGLVFPYAYGGARNALDRAGAGITWGLLSREAHLHGVGDPGWESSLRSRQRNYHKRDRELIAAAGVSRQVHAWPEAEDGACDLIARHNQAKGHPDHPEFTRMRYREWTACRAVECVTLTGRSRSVTGYVAALVWKDSLELNEIGLDGDQSQERLAVYLDLVFHHPLSYARARGLSHIRLGPEAERPKAARGAVFQNLYGGVLNAADTEKLTDN